MPLATRTGFSPAIAGAPQQGCIITEDPKQRDKKPPDKVWRGICGSEVQVPDHRTDKKAEENWARDEAAHSLGCG